MFVCVMNLIFFSYIPKSIFLNSYQWFWAVYQCTWFLRQIRFKNWQDSEMLLDKCKLISSAMSKFNLPDDTTELKKKKTNSCDNVDLINTLKIF